MVFKRTILFLALGLSFCQTESKYLLHPKFRGMIMENSFDEASGRCQYLDHRYDEGQVMVPDDKCNYQCTCYVSEYFVGFMCEPLCHRYIDYVDCMPGYEMKSRRVPAGPSEFGCECKVLECVPSFDIESFLNSRKLQGM